MRGLPEWGPGPNAPAGAAGLPDGDYYYQVTDPSGKTLLSTDIVENRRFQVSGGRITQEKGSGGPMHPTGVSQDHNAVTIRLANASCPEDFLDSPNNRGTYKVWATPVADFAGNPQSVANACGNGCFHGFVSSKSKTDNFKAKTGTATFCLTIRKLWANLDDVSPLANWEFYVTNPAIVKNGHFTGDDGEVKVCGLEPGTYTVEESPGDWEVKQLTVNGVELPPQSVYSFTWSVGKQEPVITFTNGPSGGVN
jgi:hypothetical protein